MERVVLRPPKTKLFRNKIKPPFFGKRGDIHQFLSLFQQKYNLNTPEDWKSITVNHIISNGGSRLLSKYSMFEIKCIACPEGKSSFNNSPQVPGYWENQKNIDNFLSKIKEKYNLKTPEDWNSITHNHITSNGGRRLLVNYSLYEIKCMACPEGKSIFNNPKQPKGYWDNQENIDNFLSEIKEKYNLQTPEDWNSITHKHIQSNGGGPLLSKYSIFEIKCMACPEGKSTFNKPKGYWDNQENILNFLSEIKEKYNFKTPEDWNSITQKHIISNGGSTLLVNYSLYEIKCMAYPERKSSFNNPPGYWDNQENIDNFLSKIKEKYNLQTPEDWNSITRKHIQSNGGGSFLQKYSMFEIKCMACPEGKSSFNNPPGYWDNQENIDNFLSKIKEKYNLNTPEDWNSITQKHIISNGGSRFLFKYSLYEIKCMACPEGKSSFNNPPGYWENQENIDNFLSKIKEKYNLQTPEDWNSITQKHIISNGGSRLLVKYSLYEIKCMACPEGKSIFKNPKPKGYWDNQENINKFLSQIKEKYNLNTPEDWNSITHKHIQSNGGGSLLLKYSLYKLKCMACPEGKPLFSNPPKPSAHWENQENIDNLLSKIKEKYNLNTPDDWNSITWKQIQSNGGWGLLVKYSLYEIKCMACPEGKSIFKNPKQPTGYRENQENIDNFLSQIKEKYNLNTPEDWNSITHKHIQSNGGGSLLSKYSLYKLKCMACPEGKPLFSNPPKPSAHWENQENIDNLLSKIKEKYNLQTPEDWNSIKAQHIQSNGGWGLLVKYSLYEIKCMACPEGKSIFKNPKQPTGYWENQENIDNFLSQIKEKYNLNTLEDWNSITHKHIQSNGGGSLLSKYSIYKLKCMACPEGKPLFSNPPKPSAYWENQENIDNFLSKIKEKYNLNTPDDWNSITQKHIQSNGGWGLLVKYSLYEIKCMACPEGKSSFKNPKQPTGYWDNQENILNFLSGIKEKYNLNTLEDWNSITHNHIQSNGGGSLLSKYSLYEIKCMACPEGKSTFNKPSEGKSSFNNPPGYWENLENILNFLSKIKGKYNLHTPEDWNSITKKHIRSNGGGPLLSKYSLYEIKCMACPEGKSSFKNPKQPKGYWDNQENIDNFLSKIKGKYNLQTPEDWNSIKVKHIQSNGGGSLSKYSLYEIKCMACPAGKSIFNNPKQPSGYWENQENIDNFLSKIKEKYNLQTPEDWNSITQKHIISNGGSRLLVKYSLYEIKCIACPEGKSIFKNPKQPTGYWGNQENILNFLSGIKEKYNVNTPEDWNSIKAQHIQSNGGSGLLQKHSIFEIKCMACPEGKSSFNNSPQVPGYWENQKNIDNFLSKIKEKYNLKTPEDWNSITHNHITSNGGRRLLVNYSLYEIKCMACPEGKSSFKIPPGYWDNQENIDNFLSEIKEKYNLNTPEDWNSITHKQIQSNGGSRLLSKYSLYEIKCMACPEGKSSFNNPPKPSGYWENQENILNFLSKIKEKHNLNTPEDWNSITKKQIQSNGGGSLLSKYSLYEIKCMACPEGKSSFNNPPGYWDNQENIDNFLSKIKEKFNLQTPEDWNSITKKHIQSNGGGALLSKYSLYEIKCIACPEGKSSFKNPKQPTGYWGNQENILNFLSKIKEKFNLQTPEDWNSITHKHITSNGGSRLLVNYSMFELKCMACPDGKLTFNKPKGYWDNQENIDNFLSKIKEKYNLQTLEDWNSITQNHIISNGGGSFLQKYSMFELKCMACPEGKSSFNNPKQPTGYWENQENILNFLSGIKEKYNVNTPEDWNSITKKHIQSNGGGSFLQKYSMFELKCMVCPEGKSSFNNPKQPKGYWDNQENILNFLSGIKEKYNLNTPEDWNSITHNHIQSNGGGSLLSKYSLYEIKCMACPEGKSIFNNPKQPTGYWDNQENIDNFLSKIKEKYNLKTPEDWNSITHNHIQSNRGGPLLSKYSLYEIKCMACPEGKSSFSNPPKPSGYWDNQENILNLLSKIKEKYNLQTPEDWNSITRKHIQSNGGGPLLSKYSMFEIKCMACPEGKLSFNNPPGYWENQENILNFLSKIKEKYNLQTPEDWNSITQKHIQSNGGGALLSKYSLYEIKCMACPEGKSSFNNPPGYWDNQENIDNFLSQIKEKYNLNTPEDWKRFSKTQIIQEGGSVLLTNKIYSTIKIKFENEEEISISKLLAGSVEKRSSQRWLFLQIKKLYPHEEIIEDYFHSTISRQSGFTVQFDIFMIERNIAIEYHGKQHYEDIPSTFCPVETYKHRDLEKEKLCSEHGIQLIVIPYWWDNKIESLKETLFSKIKQK